MKRTRIGPKSFAEALQARRAKQKGKRPASRFGRARTSLKRGKRLVTRIDRKLAVWSRKVRERDNFTCQMTGIRDVKRNVAHHIAPRSQRPDLRLSVPNGVTLTPEAHQKVHDNPIWARENGWLSSETYEKARKAA